MQQAKYAAGSASTRPPPPKVKKGGEENLPHAKHTIGNGVEGELGEQIRKETYHQDDILDQVDKAMDDVRQNAKVQPCGVCLVFVRHI